MIWGMIGKCWFAGSDSMRQQASLRMQQMKRSHEMVWPWYWCYSLSDWIPCYIILLYDYSKTLAEKMPIDKVSEESLRHTARHVQRILWRVYRITVRKRGFLACSKGKPTMYPTATWVLLISRIFEQAWADRAFIIPVPENVRPMNQCTKLITLNEVQSLSVSPPEGARRHSSFCTGNI